MIVNIIYWIMLIAWWMGLIKYRKIVKWWTGNFYWAEHYIGNWWTYLVFILSGLFMIFLWVLYPFWGLSIIFS